MAAQSSLPIQDILNSIERWVILKLNNRFSRPETVYQFITSQFTPYRAFRGDSNKTYSISLQIQPRAFARFGKAYSRTSQRQFVRIGSEFGRIEVLPIRSNTFESWNHKLDSIESAHEFATHWFHIVQVSFVARTNGRSNHQRYHWIGWYFGKMRLWIVLVKDSFNSRFDREC